jgi:opacity protein-like surface antigen
MRLKTLGLILGMGVIPAFGERHELGLLLGGFRPASRTLATSTPAKAEFGTGKAFYANYGLRLMGGEKVAVLFEVPFAASPQHEITSESRTLTRDVATLYVTPGIRLKFRPKARISPYVATGGGLAWFQQSIKRLDGAPNGAPRNSVTGAYNFGGGADVRVWRKVSLRGEVRDFLSGNPAFNAPVQGSVQHNVLVAGGISFSF